MKFTAKTIKALEYRLSEKHSPDGKSFHPQQIVWDESFPGFGVRVFPTGKKSFVHKYRNEQGRQHINTIGSVDKLSLDDARLKAREAELQISKGGDPLKDKNAARKGELVSDLCREFIERHAKANKKSWRLDEGRNNLYILPTLGRAKIKQVTRADVSKLLDQIGRVDKKPYVANRVREQLGKMFELAKEWGHVEEAFINPARKIKDFEEQERNEYVKPDEMPILAAAIETEPNVVARCLIWLYLLTGKRKTELLQAKWSDVDENHMTLKLSDTKNKEVEYLALGTAAWKILMQAKDFRTAGNPYIFPSAFGGTGHFVNIRKPWERIKAEALKNGAASVEKVSIHGLRHTFAVWMVSKGGADLGMIRRLLNHKSLLATKVYAKHLQPEVREAAERQGELVEMLSKPRVAPPAAAAAMKAEPVIIQSTPAAKKGFIFRRKNAKKSRSLNSQES